MMDPERVLSGESGIVEGRRRRAAGTVRDLADDAAAWLRLEPLRLAAAVRDAPPRRVHVIGIYAPDGAASMARSVAELRRSRHRVSIALGALGTQTDPLAADTRLEATRRAGEVREPERAAGGGTPAGRRLGDRPRRRCAASAPLPRSLPGVRGAIRPSARAARAAPHEPRGLAGGPAGALVGGAPHAAGRDRPRDGVSPLRRQVSCCRFPRSAWGGASTRTGADWRSSGAGGSAWWTRPPCATTRAARPAATTATPPWRSCGTSCVDRPHIERATALEVVERYRSL